MCVTYPTTSPTLTTSDGTFREEDMYMLYGHKYNDDDQMRALFETPISPRPACPRRRRTARACLSSVNVVQLSSCRRVFDDMKTQMREVPRV